jgi:pseudooxynicotine oxidase
MKRRDDPLQERVQGELNRRDLFRRASAGAGALAVATIGALPANSSARSVSSGAVNKTPGVDYDVIVIGGGFAGVTAARNAREQGYRVLLLEARDRLGGRTHTVDFEGHNIELGGTWIHWSQPFVWAEKERYGLDVVETPSNPGSHDMSKEEFIVKVGNRRLALAGEKALPMLAAFDRYFAEGREVWERPYDASYTWPAIIERDSLSTLDVLNRMKFSPIERVALESYLSAMGHGELASMSYLEMLRWWSLAGGSLVGLNDSLARYKLKDGTSALIARMIADGQPDVRLGTPVSKVEDLGALTRVTTSAGESITGAAVIVTVPMNVLPNIEFSPPLHPSVVAAGKETHASRGIKLFAKVKGKLTTHSASTALGSPDLPLSVAFTYAMDDDSTIMVAAGIHADKLAMDDKKEVQTALRHFYPQAVVESCIGHDWVHDPYSLGTWCTYRAHWYGKYYEHFGKDQGRILFASGDHGEGWRGDIDGAIGSGVRVIPRLQKVLA